MRAYDEIYLNDAKRILASAFDYVKNSCLIELNRFLELFITSGYASKFELGNPSVITGMSGEELVRSIHYKVYGIDVLPDYEINCNRTPEYWAGYVLAHYQWYTAKSFKEIFQRIKVTEIIEMYSIYHEMDIMRFIEEMERRYYQGIYPTNLKKMRENMGFSQSELSKISGVTLRAIQLYEQRVNNIDKASAHTIYKLSRVLHCDMKDLLEEPYK